MERPEEDQWPKAQIVELINRYFAAVDDKCLDFPLAESTFAPEGKVVRPNGEELVGPAAICEGQNESFARFRVTQHVMTNHVVEMEGEHARVRANVISTHLWAPGQGDPSALESHFTAGGVITVEVARLEQGWRITRLENRVVWRTGSGFVQILATGRPRT
jgi:SnoaL-like domain